MVEWLKFGKQSALPNGWGVYVISGPEHAFRPGLSVLLAAIRVTSNPLFLVSQSCESTTALVTGSTSSKRLHADHPLGWWR